ncbi:D-glycero-beta-D-manno-heptose-7-phosphate kinase [bacterium]|nr:D-glycero-beta-D-manno-heptose-7-phosphate kinase [candidate division CSSED10-310 bacterium]
MGVHSELIQTFPHFQMIIDACSKMQGHKIMVLGDIMVDEYIWGDVRRISPEAPVPVVHVRNETMQLGGSANVANNLRSLDADVELVGILGTDDLAKRVITALDRLHINNEGVLRMENRETIRKTRIIAHNQQVVRVDRETVVPISSDTETKLIDYCLSRLKNVDAVIISDYAKGTLTRHLVQSIISTCRETGKICAVDPKVKNRDYYFGCSVITPNHHEASEMSGVPLDTNWQDALEEAGKKLLHQLAADAVLVTCGERGMAIFVPDEPMQHINTVAKSVFDVTGAGDTVISAMTLGLTSGLSYADSAVLANFAAGIVVGKVGTATVTLSEIQKAMRVYGS